MKHNPGWKRVLDYMKTYGSISTVEGVNLFPAVLRLSERIRELEKQGFIIRRESLHDHTMRYHLMSERPMVQRVSVPIVLPPAFEEKTINNQRLL